VTPESFTTSGLSLPAFSPFLAWLDHRRICRGWPDENQMKSAAQVHDLRGAFHLGNGKPVGASESAASSAIRVFTAASWALYTPASLISSTSAKDFSRNVCDHTNNANGQCAERSTECMAGIVCG
jgi:hypothetical protein